MPFSVKFIEEVRLFPDFKFQSEATLTSEGLSYSEFCERLGRYLLTCRDVHVQVTFENSFSSIDE